MCCAKKNKKNVLIVSRDSDYGFIDRPNDPIINDWLKVEFKRRVSSKKNVILTDRLSQVFKLLDISISEEEEKADLSSILPLANKLGMSELSGRMNFNKIISYAQGSPNMARQIDYFFYRVISLGLNIDSAIDYMLRRLDDDNE